jgi:hypothetical protein
MKLAILLSFALLWSPLSQAVEAKAVNSTTSLEELLPKVCPWIKADQVARVKLMDPQEVGKVGGVVGGLLGDLGKSTGVDINTTDISVNLPEGVRAIMFDVNYYTNSGDAEVVFKNLHVIDVEGNQWAPDALNVLQSASETLLLCFVNGEHPVLMSATLSHRNIDGSRPTVGVSVLQTTSILPQN